MWRSWKLGVETYVNIFSAFGFLMVNIQSYIAAKKQQQEREREGRISPVSSLLFRSRTATAAVTTTTSPCDSKIVISSLLDKKHMSGCRQECHECYLVKWFTAGVHSKLQMRFDFDASAAAIAIVFARSGLCLDESWYAIDDLIILEAKDSNDKWVFICPILWLKWSCF